MTALIFNKSEAWNVSLAITDKNHIFERHWTIRLRDILVDF